MKRISNGWMGLALAVTTACTSGERTANDGLGAKTEPTPSQEASPAALNAAHKAYLDGDLLTMGEAIRDVLLDPNASALVRENAYALLDKAFSVSGGALPSRFTPPQGVDKLQLAYRRFVDARGPQFQIRFAGVIREAKGIKELTVRLLPGDTLMDKATGKGTFAVRRDAAAKARGVEEFVIDSPPLERLPDDGVVMLRIGLEDGTTSEGFVVAHGMTPEVTPTVVSPAHSATVSDPTPLIEWTPFRAATRVPFEHHRTHVGLSRGTDNTAVWEFSTVEEQTSARIGAAGVPRAPLTPADYWLYVSTVESRRFGPVEILRGTRVQQPFRVIAP